MSTATETAPAPVDEKTGLVIRTEQQPIVLSVTEATIEKKREYLKLRINGIDDKEGLALVRSRRMELVHDRENTKREAASLNELAKQHIKRINTRRDDLLALMAPIEAHLALQQEGIEVEIEKRRKAAEDEMVAERMARLAAVEGTLPDAALRAMTDDAFELELKHQEDVARKRHEAEYRTRIEEEERQRVRAEEAERNRIESERLAKLKADQDAANKAEQERLDKIRADQEAAAQAERDRLAQAQRDQDARLKAEQDRLDAIQRKRDEEAQAERDRLAAIERNQQAERDRLAAEQKRIDDERIEREHQEQLEKTRKEAAEQARKDADAQALRDKEAAEEQARQAEAARKRAEELRPDREKLAAVASAVMLIEMPVVSESAVPAKMQIVAILEHAADLIKELAAGVK